MLPKLESDQSVFFEITNQVHGGPGWEFGTCLWSPLKDTGGHNSWKILNDIKINDIILHLLKYDYGYYWVGISKVETANTVVNNSPPKAKKWANMSPYQRIELTQFNINHNKVFIEDLFKQFYNEFLDIYRIDKRQFYTVYGSNNELRIQQRYIAPCTRDIYQIFNDYSDKMSFTPYFSGKCVYSPTINEPSYPDYSTPARQDSIISRIVRDTTLARNIKQQYNWKCQICGLQIQLSTSDIYAEAHHLQPLGGSYNGPDILENIIVLCPNHHTEFDYGVIAINPVTSKIEHKNTSNPYHNKDLYYKRENIGIRFIKFHYDEIFSCK